MDLIRYVTMVVKWENDYVEKIIMIAWAMWTNRNKVRNEEDKKSNGALVNSALEYLREYELYCEKPVVAPTKEQPKCRPPWQGRYKINVNGTVFAAQKAVGVGVLIRDAEGRVVGACSKKIMAPLGAVETEAKAFEFGL
uniref:RNase H type-1 domain-containing protein n=1 Tax=Quercus lobata TaxID=97700 RepID=A0A7N2RE41_QUELO